MVRFRLVIILSLIALSLLVGACGVGEKTVANANSLPNANSASKYPTKTNAEELGMLVTIPYETEDIVWIENDAEKKLVAVLRFSPTDAAKVVVEAEKIRPQQHINLPSESWYPAELIAQSSTSGDGTLNGKSYAANGFLLPPYTTGTLTRIDNTDYFILEAVAK